MFCENLNFWKGSFCTIIGVEKRDDKNTLSKVKVNLGIIVKKRMNTNS